jgi:hypothetical protein
MTRALSVFAYRSLLTKFSDDLKLKLFKTSVEKIQKKQFYLVFP